MTYMSQELITLERRYSELSLNMGVCIKERFTTLPVRMLYKIMNFLCLSIII